MRKFNQDIYNETRKWKYNEDPEYRENIKKQMRASREKDPNYKKDKSHIKIISDKKYATVAYFMHKFSLSRFKTLKILSLCSDKVSETTTVGTCIFYLIEEAENLFPK